MIAVDTNVSIYACDQADPRRQKVALDLITNGQDGVLLWQVACEFLSPSRKLGKRGSPRRTPGIASVSFRISCRLSCPAMPTWLAPKSSISPEEPPSGTRSSSLHVSKPASRRSTPKICRGSTISTASASSTRSSRPRSKGAEEGDARPRRGWPPSPVAAIARLARDSSATAVMEAPQSTDRADVDAGRAEPGGRRFVPPGKRPSTGVAARKGRERPRPCAVHAAPGSFSGVAHAPRVSVGDVLGRVSKCSLDPDAHTSEFPDAIAWRIVSRSPVQLDLSERCRPLSIEHRS